MSGRVFQRPANGAGAHGQEIYDLLGLERENTDPIRNIAHLGVGAFAWTFVNRKELVPTPVPYVELVAPSGDIWHWVNEVEACATPSSRRIADLARQVVRAEQNCSPKSQWKFRAATSWVATC
jgi:hypothetical protein